MCKSAIENGLHQKNRLTSCLTPCKRPDVCIPHTGVLMFLSIRSFASPSPTDIKIRLLPEGTFDIYLPSAAFRCRDPQKRALTGPARSASALQNAAIPCRMYLFVWRYIIL